MAKVIENGRRRNKTYKLTGETTQNVNDDKACVIRTYAPRLRSVQIGGASEAKLKQDRLGDASVLNIYLTNPVYGNTLAEGFAVFPWSYVSEPQLDGIVVQPATLKGGNHPFANEGDTLVHETGHWLGVFHTFSGGCTLPGDGVADTAAESSPHSGCRPATDSCPDLPGEDPVFNFMDYSDDVCMFKFTAGQVSVMTANYKAYRSGSPINHDPVSLGDGVPAGPFNLVSNQMRMFTLNVPSAETVVVCRTLSDEGSLEVYMNWNGEMGSFDCAARSLSATNNVCAVSGGPGTLHVLVFAAISAPAFSVVCTSVNVPGPPVALADNVLSGGHTLAPGGAKLFTLDVSSSDISSVDCIVSLTQGRLSLLGSWDASLKSVGCSSLSESGNPARCVLDNSLADSATLLVYAHDSESLFSVKSMKYAYGGQLLSNNVAQMGSLDASDSHLYALEASTPLTIVTCTVTTDGFVNLNMRWKAGNPDCSATESGQTQKTCSIGPSRGVALIEAFALVKSKYSVTCSTHSAIALTNDVTSTSHSVAIHGFKLFYVAVPSGWSYVTCTTDSNNGNLALKMNWNGVYGSYQCESRTKIGSKTSCTIGPVLNRAYAIVYGDSAVKNFRSGAEITLNYNR